MNDQPNTDELDGACRAAWRTGAIDVCRDTAVRLISVAEAGDNPLGEARGWLHRARCEHFLARYIDALEAARRAVALCGTGAAPLEDFVRAHAVVCAASTALSRHDEAIEAGLTARQLSRALAPDQHFDAITEAADALAMAFSWSGQTTQALECFDTARALARTQGRTDWQAQLLIHRACAQAWQLIHQGRRQIDSPEGRATQATVDELLLLCEGLPGGLNAAVTPRAGRFLLGWVQVLLTCWRGEPERARVQLAAIRPLTQDERPWLDLLAVWAAAEIAWKQRAWPAAQASARRVFDEAHRISHEALAEHGAALLSTLLLAQDKHAQALEVMQENLQRRDGVRELTLSSHARLAQFLAQTHEREHRLRTRLLLPPDDSLTGLHARGYFQQRADDMLRGLDLSRARCSVLQIGIDSVDGLAQRHAPLIRDRVLCAVAGLLRQTLRAGDLPARWTHDEFAVLLHRSSADDTARVCQRIAQSVLAHDWSALTEGLTVQVNISHAQARAGDTIDSLMARCEEEMRAGRLKQRQIAA